MCGPEADHSASALIFVIVITREQTLKYTKLLFDSEKDNTNDVCSAKEQILTYVIQ